MNNPSLPQINLDSDLLKEKIQKDNKQICFEDLEQKKGVKQSLNQSLMKWTYSSQYFQFFETKIIKKLSDQYKFTSRDQQNNKSRQHSDCNQSLINQNRIRKLKLSLQQILKQYNFQIINDYKLQQSYQTSNINVRVINHMQTFEVVEIYCKLGRYSKKYIAFNAFQTSFRHQFPVIGYGGMGQVFLSKNIDSHTECAAKCMVYNPLNSDHLLENHIKQFFITDMLSSLKIGPKVLRPLRFDFIIFERCVQFELQKCQNCILSTYEQDLKMNLFQMHALNIVHSDIKPSNIMYSQQFQKNVFIDFGISDLLAQTLGQSTLTKFKGTFQYCSDDMKNVLSKKRPEKVDMYKNDINEAQLEIKIELIFKYENIRIKNIQQSQLMLLKDLEIKIQTFASFDKKESKKVDINLVEIFVYITKSTNQTMQISYVQNILNFCYVLKYKQFSTLREIKLFNSYDQIVNDAEQWIQKANQYSDNQFLIFSQNFDISIIRQRSSLLMNLQIKNGQGQQILNIEKRYRIRQKRQLMKREDIEYILFHKAQVIKFQLEFYFELFLIYTSFWLCNYKNVPIQNKIKAANIFRNVVSSKANHSSTQYLNQIYLPDIQSFRSTYSDLLWSLGYLLSYSMHGQMNPFKTNYLMLITKQTIILNFKYFLYLQKALFRYYQSLLHQPNIPILTLSIIQQIQITKLVNHHYSLILTPLSKLQDEIKQKIINQSAMKIQLQKVCNRISQLHQQLPHDKSQLLFLMGYNLQIDFQYNCITIQIGQFITNTFKLIEIQFNQFFSVSNNKSYLNYAMILIDLFKREMSSVHKSSLKFNTYLSKFIQNIKHQQISDNMMGCFINTYECQNGYLMKPAQCIRLLDERINCFNVSIYLFVDQRLKLSIRRNDYQWFSEIMNVLSKQVTFSLINASVFRTLEIRLFDVKLISHYDLKIIRNFQLFICQFIQYHLQSLHEVCLINARVMIQYHCIKLSDHILKFRQFISEMFINYLLIQIEKVAEYINATTIQYIKQYPTAEINVYNQFTYLKLTLADKASMEYCIQRKLLFQYYITVLRQFHFCSENSPKQTKYPFPFPISVFIINNLIENQYLGRILLKAWRNKKLRFIIREQNQLFLEQFINFFNMALLEQQYDILTQVILVFARQIWIKQNGQLLTLFTKIMEKLNTKQIFLKEFGKVFYQKIVKLTHNNLNQIPLFIVFLEYLSLKEFLKQNVHIWRRILYLACKLYKKYSNFKQQHTNVKNINNKILWMHSLQYLKNNKSSRKYNLVQRHWVKSLYNITKADWMRVSRQYTKFMYPSSRNKQFQKSKIQQKKRKIVLIVSSIQTQKLNFNISHILNNQQNKKQQLNNYYMSLPDQIQECDFQRTSIQKSFKQVYQIKDILSISSTEVQLLSKYKKMFQILKMINQLKQRRCYARHRNQKKEQNDQSSMIHYQQDDQQYEYQTFDNNKLDEEIQTLYMKHKILKNQVNTYMNITRQTQKFKICEQTMNIAIKLMDLEQQNLLNELVYKDQTINLQSLVTCSNYQSNQSNQFNKQSNNKHKKSNLFEDNNETKTINHYETKTINYYSCFQLQFNINNNQQKQTKYFR